MAQIQDDQVSINERVLKLTPDGPRLQGGRCADCGTFVFPHTTGCPKCAGTNVEPREIGTEGELWAWTIQGFPPHSPPYLGTANAADFKPYGVGYVTINGELKVEGRLTESDPKRLRSGMRMRLTTEPLDQDEDGRTIVTYAFEPIER